MSLRMLRAWRKRSLAVVPIRSYASHFKRSQLLSQLRKIKAQYQNYILLFQVGDFYEVYDEDAEMISAKTNLRLTRRCNKPMAGFPVKSLSEWQRTLVNAGFQLAICNQLLTKNESSRLKGREVVKLVTPGTLIEPLHPSSNYLMAIAPGPSSSCGLAWIDLSTADFQVLLTDHHRIDEHIVRVSPSEILLSQDIHCLLNVSNKSASFSPSVESLLTSTVLKELCVTAVPTACYFDAFDTVKHSHLSAVVSDIQSSDISALEQSAAGVVLWYILHTQRDLTSLHLKPPSHHNLKSYMAIDTNTRRALELTSSMHNNPKNATLLGCINKTVTAVGGRLMCARLSAPLTNIDEITSRLNSVEVFLNSLFLTEKLTMLLKGTTDLERLVQKIITGTATSGDLLALKSSLIAAAEILVFLNDKFNNFINQLHQDMEGLQDFPELVQELEKAIDRSREDYIQFGYSPEVDEIRKEIQANENSAIKLCDEIIDKCKISKLVIAFHKSYIRIMETTKVQSAKIDKSLKLIRVDATQDKVRYIHPQLQILNTEYERLQKNYMSAQEKIFIALCDKVKGAANKILATAQSFARLDVSSTLAMVAADYGWCKPKMILEPTLKITEGVHPVVHNQQKTNFVGNDCCMDIKKDQLWVVTGPNMGGKSTFLRQNALIIILSQMGSYVPAQEATIGIVDKIFARVGASDNVVKHLSTFHMEMTETANILSSATSQSFVILDEIGRGTSTNEGLAVAQAVMEHIHNIIGCRTLMATHFFELAQVASSELEKASCYKLTAYKDINGSLMFTYKIMAGFVRSSLGVDVAALAGLPKSVIERAKKLLRNSQNYYSNEREMQ